MCALQLGPITSKGRHLPPTSLTFLEDGLCEGIEREPFGLTVRPSPLCATPLSVFIQSTCLGCDNTSPHFADGASDGRGPVAPHIIFRGRLQGRGEVVRSFLSRPRIIVVCRRCGSASNGNPLIHLQCLPSAVLNRNDHPYGQNKSTQSTFILAVVGTS